ncbi:hypothetical protein B0H11DRAFT_2250558 [Mycena galericulata]|nr:hypothetical protein B0H11DRAFT_2250558 [Mycena galericulata]
MLSSARKYGLRINFDLHTIPGSQNGYNHSGTLGQVNVLNVIMGVADAQRALYYIPSSSNSFRSPSTSTASNHKRSARRARSGRISSHPRASPFPPSLPPLFRGNSRCHFASYLEAHNSIPNITGYGAGNGHLISIHDGFEGVAAYAGFLSSSDRITLDTHTHRTLSSTSSRAHRD